MRRDKMKTPWVVGIVVGAHAVAVGMVMLIQGCGTTSAVHVPPPPDPVMPPVAESDATTIAPVKIPVPDAKTWPSETTTYVVRPGDSLSVIAGNFDVSMEEIMALNGIKDADRIRGGQKLVLPGKIDVSAYKPPPVRKKPRVTVPPGTGLKYTVKSGDSLSVIAARHGAAVKAIREANGLAGDKILVGQTLVIPGGKAAAGVAPVKPAALPPSIPESKPAVGGPGEIDITAPAPDPVPAPAVAPDPAVETRTPDAPVSMRKHTVTAGEDLYSVSLMWDVSVAELKEVNNLTGTDLTPGQVLKIPMTE
jgi:LysM repeat protein